MKCPLCESSEHREADRDERRCFIRCVNCGLVFVPKAFHLTREQERRRYDLHDNTKGNRGYLRFLTQVADIVETACPPPGRLLDYGCGEDAVLTALLRRRGRRCDPFDPLYGYELPPSPPRYDMIILCEVIEHFRKVRSSLQEIGRLLEERGKILVRTQCYPSAGKIVRWWYAQDPTHINFFSHRALECAAGLLDRRLEATAVKDIYLMR